MLNYLLLCTLLIILLPSVSLAQHDIRDICGHPPEFTGRLGESAKLKGELDGKAQFLSRLVGDVGFSGTVESERRSLYQSADKISSAQQAAYLSYMLCVIIMKDTSLDTKKN